MSTNHTSNSPVTAPKNDEPQPQVGRMPIHYPFWFGGSASSMAACVTHPLDLIKVRLQTRTPDAPHTMLRTFTYIIHNEGVLGLYAGLTAALLRQMTYSTVRFGVYEDLKVRFAPKPQPGETKAPQPSMITLIAMSSFSGFIGGIVGNPGDVLNVRMQSDASKPPEQRRNYKHAVDGLIRMTKEEGVSSLFRGVGANSTRALLMTSSQLASYDIFKSICVSTFKMGDNFATHFTASLAAGFVATTLCSPVDVVKSRIMSAKSRLSVVEILKEATKKEGWLWMFRGWVPSFIRLGPQTICTMLFFEQHKKLYREWRKLESGDGDHDSDSGHQHHHHHH